MTASQAFERIMHFAVVTSVARNRPGAIVEHAATDVRAALRTLTSDDLHNIRDDEACKVITPSGFCHHGNYYTERCVRCGR
tara:strand:+ start:780 stop:1022 length:243 start_codon:yes stop_codon:yes gene_type:complete